MMKKVFLILLILVIVLSITFPTFAHSGRTDSQGGHHDRSNGSYHYHHGYPAHDHPNGECPYTNTSCGGCAAGETAGTVIAIVIVAGIALYLYWKWNNR